MNLPDSLSRIPTRVVPLALIVFMLAGCSRDNGLPRDVISHLKARGILIEPLRLHAPHSERGGFLAMKYDAPVATKIVLTFDLKPIPIDDSRWVLASRSLGGVAAKEVWGVSGRPAQFKLKDGGQLEYFFLMVAADGQMYLLAEYAYG